MQMCISKVFHQNLCTVSDTQSRYFLPLEIIAHIQFRQIKLSTFLILFLRCQTNTSPTSDQQSRYFSLRQTNPIIHFRHNHMLLSSNCLSPILLYFGQSLTFTSPSFDPQLCNIDDQQFGCYANYSIIHGMRVATFFFILYHRSTFVIVNPHIIE
jgi:hypothetical protein